MRASHVAAALAFTIFSTNALAQSAPRVPVRVALAQFGTAVRDPNAVADAPRPDNRAAWQAHLAQQRAAHLAVLEAYANAGEFPRNTNGVAYQNIFRDERGVLCAVANMMYRAGATSLVDATASENNGVRLGEVHSGPLLDWILTSGFTQEEIAAIQEPDMPMFGANDPAVIDAERARGQAHFRAVLTMLRSNTERSLNTAFTRLGARVQTGAPSRA